MNCAKFFPLTFIVFYDNSFQTQHQHILTAEQTHKTISSSLNPKQSYVIHSISFRSFHFSLCDSPHFKRNVKVIYSISLHKVKAFNECVQGFKWNLCKRKESTVVLEMCWLCLCTEWNCLRDEPRWRSTLIIDNNKAIKLLLFVCLFVRLLVRYFFTHRHSISVVQQFQHI